MNNLALLKKYIEHIEECEGSTFIHWINSGISRIKFTEKEVAVLKQLDKELTKDTRCKTCEKPLDSWNLCKCEENENG